MSSVPLRQPSGDVRRYAGRRHRHDPIGYGRPHAVTTYINEIKKVTNKPIKYLIYSHHHYDHIAGGQPFKDAGRWARCRAAA